jgi:hypothetical protein
MTIFKLRFFGMTEVVPFPIRGVRLVQLVAGGGKITGEMTG